jgi:radical SAM superfamily enzyme YgiQ (UPF0313 family)
MNNEALSPELKDESITLCDVETHLNVLFNERPVQRILLIHPPDASRSSFNSKIAKRGANYNFPPYGLGVVAQALLEKKLDVKVCNLNQSILKECRNTDDLERFSFQDTWKNHLYEEVNAFKPDLVGVGCLFTMTHDSLVHVCQEVKKISTPWLGSNSTVPLAVGGVHVSQYIDKVLTDLPEVDFAFLYESEFAFLNFVEVVNKKRPLEDLAQLVINKIRGRRKEFSNRVQPNEEEINISPAFELIGVSDFSKNGRVGSFDWARDKGISYATSLSNRGCRAACTFCNVRYLNGVGVRKRSLQSVIDELKQLRDKFGVGHVSWLDDDLLYDERRAVNLFNEMVAQNVNLTWDAMNGVIASSCSEEVVAAMAASGCIGANIGVESGNPEILKNIKKPGTVETFLKAAENFQRHESINVRAFLMLGFPNETYRMILDTINLATKMNLDWHSTTVLHPWLKTPIYNTMSQLGLLDGDDKKESNKDGRYSAGPFGSQREAEEHTSFPLEDFFRAFDGSNLDRVPPKEMLINIWFYINYFMNFFRLFFENRTVKLQQQLRMLGNMRTVVTPENGFAMYFLGFLQKKIEGTVDQKITADLEAKLASSSFWSSTFLDLNLSPEHLKKEAFPQNHELDARLKVFFNSSFFDR